MLVDINVVAQVESTAKKTSSSDDNQEDEEESLPITVQSSIVNKNPDFNSRSGKNKQFLFFSHEITLYVHCITITTR